MAGRRNVPAVQANMLWAASGNRCAYLGCDAELITFDGDQRVNVGEVAHIHAQSEGGARYRADLPVSYVDSFENCMIMCRKHHKFIDSDENKYPAELLRAWKASHDEKHAVGSSPAAGRAQLGAPPPLARPFVERADLVERLRTSLEETGRCSLLGISGAGKSQLALSFLDGSDGYTFRWWVRATTPDLFESDLAAIGAYIGVEALEQESLRDVALRVRSALENIPGWLLVIDDAAAALDSSLIPAKAGHVILTTQNAGFANLAQVISIPPLDDSQSRQLLRDLVPTVDASDDQLDQLASFCSGLPLAVAQVGSYLATTHTPIGNYIEIVRTRRAELMARGSGGTHATLDVTISDAVQGIADGSRQVLELLSVMAPMPIDLTSEDFSELPLETQPNPLDPLGFEDVIAELRSLSLIDRAGNTVAMHELVQTVIRRHLDGEATIRAVLCAAAVLMNQVPTRVGVPTEWPKMERLLPHINAIIDRLTELSVAPGATAMLLNRAGLYHYSRGSADLAESAYSRGLALLDSPDLDPEDTALRGTLLNNMGNMELARGEFELAEQTMREALRCKRAGLAPDNAMVGIALAALAVTVEQLGRAEDARSYHLEALEIYRRAGDDAHVADCLTDLANLAIGSQDYESAAAYLDEALTVAGIDDQYWPELSNVHLVCSALYEATGDSIEAIGAARRAAVVAKSAVERSLHLARALSTEGRLLGDEEDLKPAIALMEQAHSMFLELGADAVDVAMVKGNLGTALVRDSDAADRGIALLRESLEIATRVLPSNHRTVQMAVVLLAEGLVLTGDHEGAFDLVETLRPQDVSDREVAFRAQVLLHQIALTESLGAVFRARREPHVPDLRISYSVDLSGRSAPPREEGESAT